MNRNTNRPGSSRSQGNGGSPQTGRHVTASPTRMELLSRQSQKAKKLATKSRIFEDQKPTSFPMNTSNRLYNTPCLQGDPQMKHVAAEKPVPRDEPPKQLDRLFPVVGPTQLKNKMEEQRQAHLPGRFDDVLGFQRDASNSKGGAAKAASNKRTAVEAPAANTKGQNFHVFNVDPQSSFNTKVGISTCGFLDLD